MDAAIASTATFNAPLFTRLSLKLRAFGAALLVLVFFIPLSTVTLERAFSHSLSEAMLEQLRVLNLSLISEFELDEQHVFMPEQLYNEKLNMPGSGVYGFIVKDQQVVWQSISSITLPLALPSPMPRIGQELFDDQFGPQQDYFSLSYTAEFESFSGFSAVSFVIVHDKVGFNAQRRAFQQTLWYWLALLALVLMLLLLFSLSMALNPINTLIQQIKRAESGELKRIEQHYPPELEKLKTSLNHLLDTEQQQRERYKNSLGDLAHSLKTPLAVVAGTENLPHSAKEPLQQINNIIQRQLKRAVAVSGSGWEQAIPLQPLVNKLCNAMQKVYRDKSLDMHIQIAADHQFKGDETDLMELLGNLLDNACKAAHKRVKISSVESQHYCQIQIEDDGPGIAPQQRQALLERGKRLDAYSEGQGIGMAVVMDLVAAYQGQLNILSSTLGGANIQLRFPV